MKKKYVLIGASLRSLEMYAFPMLKELSESVEVVGLFDPNPLRIEAVKKLTGLSCPSYTNFDQMMKETKPDSAVVTTIDRFHHEYIIKCLEAGVDAVTEKPMTIGAEQCAAILEAEQRTGQKVTVAFNYRFAPYAATLKEVLQNGVIGNVLNVDFEWILDTWHGADYFRRWHRRKENSGGLLVHKATHHFDLVNWWIDDLPVDVMAYGNRRFYGPTRKAGAERCLTCERKNTCEFYFNIDKEEWISKLYHECESFDHYYRDRCVFADDIDIEDSMSVNVEYSKGTLLSYSLIAHSPYEGWRISLSGTDGRIEAQEFHRGLRSEEPTQAFDIFDRNGRKIEYTVPKDSGGHGGGDAKLLKMIFTEGVPDPLHQQAGSSAGAASIMVGVAANKSIAEGRNILIRDLLPLGEFRTSPHSGEHVLIGR